MPPAQSLKVRHDLQALNSLMVRDPKGWRFLSQGGLSADGQRKAMEKILKTLNVCEVTLRFVRLVLKHRRVIELPGIIGFYEEACERAGREMALLQTARPLDSSTLQTIQDTLAAVSPEGVWLRTHVSPQLLGGGILFWRGFMIDGSVKNFLDQVVA